MEQKTVEDLRSHLWEQMERTASGEITPASANASANIVGKFLQSVKMELEYNKMAGTTPNISFLNMQSKKISDATKKLTIK